MNTKIIGLSGTNGAGKDQVGAILAERFGYMFITVTESLRAEARARSQPVEREFLRAISSEWRSQYGLGVLVDKAMTVYQAAPKTYRGVVMASLRNPGEADRIHELGGTVVWIDADPQVRYNRIQNNADLRNRKEEDNKTFQQFQDEELAEMHASGDATTLHMLGVKKLSDVFITNDGDSLEVLTNLLAETLQLPT
jgi:shikimate kinase